jgi:serine/threonine protein kinase
MSISHKNIVKAFGYKIEESRFLLFMELMVESVRDKILRSNGKKLDEHEALAILQQVLEGLVHLHTLKPEPIVHRDIKCTAF